MLTAVLIFVVILLIIYLIDFYIHNTKDARIFDKIPGTKLIPVLGNIPDFLLGPVPVFYQKRSFANRFKNIYKEYAGPVRVVNLYNPEDIEIVLSNPKYINKGMLYDILHPWLNDGLLTSTGEKWQKRRKILTPAFHFNILKGFCKIFGEQSARLVEKIKNEVGKNDSNVVPLITQFALNSISETAMGLRIDSKQREVNKYQEAIYEIGEFSVYRLVRLWLRPDFMFNMTSVGKKQSKVLSTLHTFTTDVIRERRRTISLTEMKGIDKESYNDDDIGIRQTRLAMLDLLLLAESRGNIDEAGVREEVDTFMFEGHDTTTMAISFCLMLLANNKASQDKIVEELDEIFSDTDAPVTIDDLNKMKYTERCIKEALRLYPSVPFIGRQLAEEVQLKDYKIPGNTVYEIHIFDLHRNGSIFPAPDVFDPDRFLMENSSKRHPFAYIPFSAGPRNCIGQKFAMLEEKSVISSILRNFVLEPVTTPDDIIFSADLVLRSKDPIRVKFLPRKLKKLSSIKRLYAPHWKRTWIKKKEWKEVFSNISHHRN